MHRFFVVGNPVFILQRFQPDAVFLRNLPQRFAFGGGVEMQFGFAALLFQVIHLSGGERLGAGQVIVSQELAE